MTVITIIRTIAVVILFASCINEKSLSDGVTKQGDNSIDYIEINLLPAFNNSSSILIDNAKKTVQFKVDTAIKTNKGTPTLFRFNLDSFRVNTLVDSFYSKSFLDLIKFNPKNSGMRDGLSIYTVIKRGSNINTIVSGNVYPKALSTNIISQINYIFKNTTDKALKKYIKDLRSYFE